MDLSSEARTQTTTAFCEIFPREEKLYVRHARALAAIGLSFRVIAARERGSRDAK